LETSDLPNVHASGAEHGPRLASSSRRGSPAGLPSQPGFFKPSNEYVEKHFTLRIQRRDGTSKLLLGVTGSLPKLGSIKEIKLAQDEVLKVKVVIHPRRDAPAEAIEV
jgi:hypothetical protein